MVKWVTFSLNAVTTFVKIIIAMNQYYAQKTAPKSNLHLYIQLVLFVLLIIYTIVGSAGATENYRNQGGAVNNLQVSK
ncbi:MAG: hypothetical protein EAY72_05690 [Bacteroidetes bacterium]|nr:MAG: hypothetical protein EAY72_05690 [Bacteroidota bacterium]TAE68138.1 MAG: hypothetical protein EAY68_04800 [Bacteroidota bacterium]